MKIMDLTYVIVYMKSHLCEDRVVTLSIILTRLQQNLDEWCKSRAEMKKVGVEVSAKNYHKSLLNLQIMVALV